MSGVVIGDSDYKPYSLEAAEAWGGRAPTGIERIKSMIGYRAGGLTDLANEIQKKGRGDDRMLVHMTPKEVAGLQAIAKAHGGSLTINPDTGLVEAGFLKNLMPMIIGAGVGALSSAAMGKSPFTGALLGGATGGAFGGAGGFGTIRGGDGGNGGNG